MPRKDAQKMQEIRAFEKKWDDHWKYNRDQYHLFMSFVMGSQWQDDEARLFENYKKIPLQVNKLAPLANHLVGEYRQNTPSLQVVPEDNVDQKTVEVRAALVKQITLNSHSKIIQQNAFKQAVIGGFSAYRIGTKYVSDYSFDQEIIQDGFADPTWCYWDVSATSPCKTDGMASGFRTRISRTKFRSLYGKALEKKIGVDSNDDSRLMFTDEEGITIHHHYEREFKTTTLYQLSNNESIVKKELDLLNKVDINGVEMYMMNGEPVAITNERDIPQYTVKFYKGAGEYILEEEDFPSEQLPIIYVDQDSYYDKKGKQVTRPFMKDVRDAQRFLNYLATQIAYILKVSRWDQFMASKQNVRSPDTQNIWRDPQTIQGALIYDESPNGNKPEQLRPPELSASLESQYVRTLNDIQSSTGIYQAQMGQEGNDTSGAHNDRRVRRGRYTTDAPFSASHHATAVAGEIINEMIPKVYDVERLLMLDMPDRGMKPISINKPMDEYGLQIENDMKKGRYKVRLMPGASMEGQKEESLESMNQVLAHDPEAFRLIADLYVENLNFPNSLELRNRLRTLVPPEIIEAGKTGEPLPPKEPQGPPPEIMIMMQELKLKEQEMKIKQQDLERKAQMQAVEMQQDAQLEWQKLEAERLEAAAKLKEMELKFMAEMHRTNTDVDIAHANNLIKLLTHTPKEPKNDTSKRR